ncbi:MAG: penicillin acylase family protein, partial [Caulobacter sp.]|nr:penicillin acylase family protein [Caulobacter sp.]
MRRSGVRFPSAPPIPSRVGFAPGQSKLWTRLWRRRASACLPAPSGLDKVRAAPDGPVPASGGRVVRIGKLLLLSAACSALSSPALAQPAVDLARQRAVAQRVQITRDDWGIAHVHGKSDADAVFGMVYAQAEDDFPRIEANYLTNLGRKAEAEGEKAIWQDLRMRLFVDPADLQDRYARSPAWLKALMDAWADGLNYYLATHPNVKPKVLNHFEPWMALSFTEGSIGGDVERISLGELEAFYGKPQLQASAEVRAREFAQSVDFHEPTGSNGFAIAPSNTKAGHALLLINPHTSFFFRSELQMTSDAGLNAYGAATWGQFFVYQGFNAHAGWMHTSSTVDVVDEFAETITRKDGKLVYRYGAEERPVETRVIEIAYRTADGSLAKKSFTTYRTHHGPIVRAADGKWIAFAMMYKPFEPVGSW